MSKRSEEWTAAFLAAGHTFVLDEEGRPDFFATSYDIHNGPVCSKCNWSCCHHCIPKEQIPECRGSNE